ncbi:sugar transferase [Catellatospora tritici]|uniref:sugar transferase n=1 Tax=Catellatospora tritici TaxID=2851566 RepID=UPI0027DF1E86|nr:sugar transferase [Catellatospora tritici]
MTTVQVGAKTPSTATAPARKAAVGTASVKPQVSARSGWESRYVKSLVVGDATVGLVAALVALRLIFGRTALEEYLYFSLSVPVTWIVTLFCSRAYDRRYLFVGNDEYQRVLRSGLILAAAIGLGSYALDLGVARGYVVIAVPIVTFLGLVSRYLLRRRLHRAWADGKCLRRVVVVGHESSVIELTRQLRHERYHGLGVVAACVPVLRPGTPLADMGIRVYNTIREVPAVVRDAGADTVVVLTCPELAGAELRRLAWRLEQSKVDLMVASALIDVANSRTTIRPADGLPMLHLDHPRFSGTRHLVKDMVDRVGAALLLLAFSPLLLFCALAIRLPRDGRGPVFFKQIRVGQNGKEFPIFKLRSMYVDAESRLAQLTHLNESSDGVLFKMRNDPRVTPIGRFLRRFSVDELPQLINVLRGEMSLVGPRPPLPSEVASYPADMHRRLVVKPGLTGLWQVSGRADLSWDESMRLDLRYVENWSLTLDLVILLRTCTAVLRSSGAY